MARYTVLTVNQEIFEQLLAHAPAELKAQATDNAERIVFGLCFTEDDILEHYENDPRWERLSSGERMNAIEKLLYSGKYEHVTAAANDAIAEAVDRYLDETIGTIDPENEPTPGPS